MEYDNSGNVINNHLFMMLWYPPDYDNYNNTLLYNNSLYNYPYQ